MEHVAGNRFTILENTAKMSGQIRVFVKNSGSEIGIFENDGMIPDNNRAGIRSGELGTEYLHNNWSLNWSLLPTGQGQTGQQTENPNCITNVIPNSQVSKNDPMKAGGSSKDMNIMKNPPYGPDLTLNSHDGIHIVASKNEHNNVRTLPAMKGTVLHYGFQNDGEVGDVSVLDILLVFEKQ